MGEIASPRQLWRLDIRPRVLRHRRWCFRQSSLSS